MLCYIILLVCAQLWTVEANGYCRKKSYAALKKLTKDTTCELDVMEFCNLTAVVQTDAAGSRAVASCASMINGNITSKKYQTQKRLINCYYNVCISASSQTASTDDDFNKVLADQLMCVVGFALNINTNSNSGGRNTYRSREMMGRERKKTTAKLFRMYHHWCITEGKEHNYTNERCIGDVVRCCFLNENVRQQGFLRQCLQIMSKICDSVEEPDSQISCSEAVRGELSNLLVSMCGKTKSKGDCTSVVHELISETSVTVQDLTLVISIIGGLSSTNNMQSLKLLKRTFNKHNSRYSNLLDDTDANVIMAMFDRITQQRKDLAFGSTVLQSMEMSVRAFGQALLAPKGRLEPDYRFTRPDTRLHYYISKRTKNYHSSPSAQNASVNDAIVVVPVNQLCKRFTSNSNITKFNGNLNRCKKPPIDSDCRTVVGTAILNNLGDSLSNASNNSSHGSLNTVISSIVSLQIIDENGVSVSVSNSSKINITFLIPSGIQLLSRQENYTVSCRFWDSDMAWWSDEGVDTINITETSVSCSSSHLTSFAVLLDHQNVISNDVTSNVTALNTIAHIGTALSFISLVITVIFLSACRKKLKRGPLLYVHLNFAVSLALALLVLLVGLGTATPVRWLCGVVAGLLHYLFLSTFCWMLAEAIMLYLMVVKVFGGAAEKWYYLLPLGWGAPIVVVVVTASVRPNNYGHYNINQTHYCWLSTNEGTIWAFIGPVIAIICINSVILFLAILEILKIKCRSGAEYKINKFSAAITAVKGAIVLLPLLGITWIVGIFAININTVFFIWIFTIVNSFQGVAVLVVHVLRTQIVLSFVRRCFARSSVISSFSKTSQISTKASITPKSSVVEFADVSSQDVETEYELKPAATEVNGLK